MDYSWYDFMVYCNQQLKKGFELKIGGNIVDSEHDYEKMIYEATVPHLSRIARKISGSPVGNLKCQMCGSMEGNNNRQRTAYHNSDNMAILCPACQDEADKYWDDMWSEYYSQIM